MTLTLHEHPFASYCWKVLLALYERELTFERNQVNDEARYFREYFPLGWPDYVD